MSLPINLFSAAVGIQILCKSIHKHMTVVCEKIVGVCCCIISGPILHLTQCAATETFPLRTPRDLTRTWTAPQVDANAPLENFTTKQDHAVSEFPWPYHVAFAFSLAPDNIGQVHFSNVVVIVVV